MPYKSRQTGKLLKGRQSIPGAIYFLTWVTYQRARVLNDGASRGIARTCLTAIDKNGDGTLLAANVMPDHIHLLLELGSRLSVSELVAKIKAGVSRGRVHFYWQLNFFDHQLRTADSVEDFAFYIFMNPYCAGLCSIEDVWPGWIPSSTIRWSFEEKLRNGKLPHPEWLAKATRFGAALPEGAH
jgi:putative transposase